ncbi:MAG: alcohol dehydrogenase catalytic domain-containing protein [Candidatus Hodarchaeota archaeon]
MRLHEYDQPLKLSEVDVPKLGPKDALVRIRACGVCHTDIHFLQGELKTEMFEGKRPWTLGHEIAGKVVEVGREVAEFAAGDSVLVDSWTAYSCGSCIMCRTGFENCCIHNSPPGFARDGGYAEYIAVPTRSFVRIGGLKPEDVATLSCCGVTSFRALRKAAVTPSDIVVVYGAGGAGTFAIQIAKAMGASVIAISRSEEKLKMAKRFGADYAVGGRKDPVSDVREITNGNGVNVVLDFVGSEQTLGNGLKMLTTLGQLLVIGVGPGPLKCMPNDAVDRELTISGVKVGTHKDLVDLVMLAKRGMVKSITTKTFKLDEANEALGQLKRGQILGRSVIQP